MTFSGKMWYILLLKVTNNKGFTLSLEDTFFELHFSFFAECHVFFVGSYIYQVHQIKSISSPTLQRLKRKSVWIDSEKTFGCERRERYFLSVFVFCSKIHAWHWYIWSIFNISRRLILLETAKRNVGLTSYLCYFSINAG